MSAASPSPARPAVILVEPKEPGNVGAAARAMKNMGLSDLRLVAPRCALEKARPLASHAADLLERATVHEQLLEALADRDLVVGTTARLRRDQAPPQTPRALAPRVAAAHAPAVVFGREESGLSNDELDRCQLTLTIPTGGDYASLNLSQAVLLVAYELMLGREAPGPPPPRPLAGRERLEAMYGQLLEFMLVTGYTDTNRQEHALRRLRRVFDRSELDENEVAMLRGLLAQGLWAARRGREAGEPEGAA